MRWLLLTLIVLQAANCGQTGPLRLPEQDTMAARIFAPLAADPHAAQLEVPPL